MLIEGRAAGRERGRESEETYPRVPAFCTPPGSLVTFPLSTPLLMPDPQNQAWTRPSRF